MPPQPFIIQVQPGPGPRLNDPVKEAQYQQQFRASLDPVAEAQFQMRMKAAVENMGGAFDYGKHLKDEEDKKRRASQKDLQSVLGASGIPGGGAVGSLLSGAAATAGPAAVILAAKELERVLVGSITSAIRGVGHQAAAVGRLDPGAYAEGLIGIMEKGPALMQVFASIARAGNDVVKAFDETAERLAQYSSTLAVAQANRQVTQVLGDMRRAQLLGPELAAFVSQRTEATDAAKDLLAVIAKQLLPIVTGAVAGINDILKTLENAGNALGPMLQVVETFPDWLKELLFPLIGAARTLVDFARERSEVDKDAARRGLEEALNLPGPDAIPGIGQAQVQRALAAGGRLNIPF